MKKKPSMVDVLRKKSSGSWFKLSKETKAEFKRAKSEELKSRRAGFVLGGSLEQVL